MSQKAAMNLSALSSLPVWAQASRGSSAPGLLTSAQLPGGLVTFLLGSRLAEVAKQTTEVIHLCVQNGKDFAQRKLQVDVKFPGEAQETSETTPAPFEEILVASGARALALFSPSCCAVVALSERFHGANVETRPEKLEALVVAPRAGQKLVKVAWHPMSDAHLGVLFSDGSWSLLNLALSLDEPEVHFPAPMGVEIPVDFQFLAPGEDGLGESPEDLWLSMSVFFLAASGRISFRNPVLPSAAVLSRRSSEAVQLALQLAAAQDDFAAQLAAQLRSSQVEEVLLLRHQHHLNGGAQPFSLSSTGLLEQVVEEAVEAGSERSERSSGFSSLQVCCSSPLLILARASRGGPVELLALEKAIGPYGAGGTVAARVLEEIDLMCNKSTPDDFVRLESLGERSGLIVHTRSLLASIDVSLSTPGATVTTLAETRSNDMDFASWSRVDQGVGLLLRMERSSKDAKPRAVSSGGSAPSKSFLTLIELPKKEKSPEKAPSEGHMSKLSPSSLHLLEQPVGSSKATSVAKPAELAKRVATLRSGIASLQCRQDFLKHLAEKSFPARAEVLKQELQLETATLRRSAADGAQRAQALRLRQEELVQRQAALVKALSAASEAQQLEELGDAALPKLFAQLYELRRAAELLRSSQQALAETPEAIQRPKTRQLMLAQN